MVKIVATDDGDRIYSGNRFVAYVSEGKLFAFDHSGFAIEIGTVDGQKPIAAIYLEWRNKQ